MKVDFRMSGSWEHRDADNVNLRPHYCLDISTETVDEERYLSQAYTNGQDVKLVQKAGGGYTISVT